VDPEIIRDLFTSFGPGGGAAHRLISRGGYDWTGRYPWIVESALKNRHQ
jgi:hypothetical protein